jgi:hypothetical protein
VLVLALAWLSIRPAEAARVFVDAVIRPDLQTVVGTMRVDGAGIRLVDPQSLLPMPDDDRERRRTFPGAPEKGWIHLEPLGDGEYAFHSILPARYDATGKVPGRGLYANGLWLPQPVTGTALATVDWVVDVELPPGSVAILNGVAGTKQMRWSGTAERLALAVIPNAYASFLTLPQGQVAVISDHHISTRQTDRLEAILVDAWPSDDPPSFMVVISPLRRRLVRAAPGMLFLSDRALRLTDGLWHYHVGAVRKGLLEAGLTAIADPFARSFAATALADARKAQPDAGRLLGWASWVPVIDSVLYSGSLPFYSEVFDETYPGDPLRDDLAELFGPEQQPARAVVRMIDARFGVGTSEKVARQLVAGESFPAALQAANVPLDLVSEWRRAGPDENLHLEVHQEPDKSWTARVERDVTVDAPPVAVPMRIDGLETVWLAHRGADVEQWTFDSRPKEIVVDAQGIIRQSRVDDDRFPTRWTAVVAALPYELDLRRGRISAFADVALRRQYDTRWVFDLAALTDPEDIVAFDAGVYHYLGPLKDRRTRPYRLSLSGGPALLDPAFRPTDGGNVALGAAVAATWDTRVEDLLPTSGHRVALVATGGLVPSSEERWTSLSLRALGLAPIGGRVTAAARVVGAVATGDVEHRLLTLGGTGDVQAIPEDRVVGDRKAGGAVELRWNAIRNASVPLPLLWASDMQISAGVDQGVLWSDDGRFDAVGWTGGLFFVGDLLGAQPAGIGAWVAGPLVWAPDDLVAGREELQLYIRLNQAF